MNEGLRDRVDRFTTATTAAVTQTDPASARNQSLTTAMEWAEHNKAIGAALRSQYP